MDELKELDPEIETGLWSYIPRHDALPQIMGILNVTPDSFSDGGRFFSMDQAVAHGLKMAEEGADIIDIGGESTRPGSDPVPPDEQIKRVCPVIAKIFRSTDVPISIDTSSSIVAREALSAGAAIINNVSALRFDEEMVNLVAEKEVGLILMHMKGSPKDMQKNPHYDNLIKEVFDFLEERAIIAERAGVLSSRIVIDPGIGFGKTLEGNIELIKNIPYFRELGYPVLIGASRKAFIGKITGREVDDRLAGSLAINCICALNGVDILRVHDVKETMDALKIIFHF